MEHWAQKCDGAGVDPAEYAAVCKERDELQAALDGAKLSMKALNEKLVEITAERDAMKLRMSKFDTLCDLCCHEHLELPCADRVDALECDACPLDKGVCCTCVDGSGYMFKSEKEENK